MQTSSPKTRTRLKGRALEVQRGGTTILQSIDFVARSGELVGVLGPSGSGKSTLLLALSGFKPATDGKVTLKSRDLYEAFEELKRQIGFVPQDDIVPTQLKVERVLKYAAELRLPHFTDETRQGRIDGVIRALGLEERRRLRVGKLSGGQRKRVSIAVELLSRPELLFADEPTSGLDPALEQSLMQTLREMADQGRIVVVTTHIMSSLHLLDTACVLHEGRLVYYGPPGELKDFFGVDDFTRVYHRLTDGGADKWRQQFTSSPLYQRHLRRRL